MQRVWKRIALHGLLTAFILGVLGVVFAELASIWMASAAPARTAPVGGRAAGAEGLPAAVRTRVPLTMAAFGFAFVAVGELLLYAVRGDKPVPVKKVVADGASPDTAERLLEELLQQADAAMEKEKANKTPQGDAAHAGSILTPDP